MDAAFPQQVGGQGAPRILRHCDALAQVTASERPSARDRLELELGYELAGLLIEALSAGGSRRHCLAVL
jgi:hypothetical protein